MELVNLINEVAKKEDVVFVGGTSLYLNKLEHTPRDIDMVVNNLDGLNKFGEVVEFTTEFQGSKSGKRAYIMRDDFMIDIFVEETLPDFNTDGLVKFQTIPSLLYHYEEIMSKTEGKLQDIMVEKINHIVEICMKQE